MRPFLAVVRAVGHVFAPRHLRGTFGRSRLCEALESRWVLAAPAVPVIIEPLAEGQITGTFDINLQTDPARYSDADGHAWQSTEWRIREQAGGAVVWQTGFLAAPPLALYRVDFSDGTFVGPLAGRTELNYNTNYQLVVRYRDANSETSGEAVRGFTTASANQPVPGAGTWLVRPGYVVEPVQTGLRLPVNIAFVPNPGTNPTDPLYYVSELYGSIQVVRRDGTRSTFASGLLDYNPQGPISGSGEQGLTGIAVERDSGNPNTYHLYVGMLWDNGAPAGGAVHYPKVERLTSAAGGLTMGSRTVLLNMQPETQGQSHQISNVTIGPDNKLYVHMGDGFAASTALNLEQFRGKVLRMNKNGTPVATGDPAGANPFYNAADGISARDFVYTYGHRNPFGGAWEPDTGKHWVVENGNSLDRMVDLVAGASYGWAGNDSTHVQFSKYIWSPATAPVNIDFVDSTRFGGSMFPAEALGSAFVSLSGSTYAAGPQQRAKSIVEFTDLLTLGGDGKLAVQPSNFVKYNGTGRATVSAVAAGPDGLYFSDLYEDTGAGGATGSGANIYRVRYVGNAGGQVPTVATPATATPPTLNLGSTTQLSVLGADDGGEANLTYTWGAVGNPPGPVAFSANGSNAARNTVATFTANGTYNLFVIIRDVGGQSAISNVTVTVNSAFTDTGNGLTGNYFNNIDFTAPFQTRNDAAIDFDWGTGAPIAGMGTNTFSVRWTGFVAPRFTGTYTFYTTTDDGVRLWVDNLATPLIDRFVDQGPTTWTGTINLTAGQVYPIRMDYFENSGGAVARLEWSSPSQAREVVPRGRLYTAAPTAPAAPSNLNLATPSGTQINLTWTDNANNESGFIIQRGTNGTTFTTIATRPAGTTSFNDTGLIAGTQYFYRVRAVNPAGESNFVQGSATTPGAPPTVVGVYADSSAWAAAFRTYLQTAGLGTSALGLRIPAGADQLMVLPLTNLNRLRVVFSRNVTVDAADLSVRGVTVANYAFAPGGFSYDAATFTATWTLAADVANDRLLLDLDGDAPGGVTDGTSRLDGEWANGSDSFPSGNGTAGGDFEFRLNVLPGDVNRSGSVLADDFSEVKRKFFSSTINPGTGAGAYSAFHDINGSGSILADDFSAVKQRFFDRLPDGQPAVFAPTPFGNSLVHAAPTRALAHTTRRGAFGPEYAAGLLG